MNYDGLNEKLRTLIEERFPLIYWISLGYQTYLVGGAIRSTLLGNDDINDLDFVILTNKDILKNTLSKLDPQYKKNEYGSYKVNYDGVEVDLWCTSDLFDTIEYNADGLLYDIHSNKVISLTFNDFIKNGLKLINKDKNLDKDRKEVLEKFHKDLKKRNEY